MTGLEPQLRRALHDAYDQPSNPGALATRVPVLHRERRRRRAIITAAVTVTTVVAAGGFTLSAARSPYSGVTPSTSTYISPASATPAPATTAGNAGLIHVGGLSWQLPHGWHAATATASLGVPSYQPQVAAVIADTALPTTCNTTTPALACIGAIGAHGQAALITQYDSRNIEGDTGTFGPTNNTGTFNAPDAACRSLGGSWSWTWQRLYGLRSHGHVVQIDACVTGTAPDVRALLGLAQTVRVLYYPDLGAGRSGATGPDAGPYYLPGKPGYASTLCHAAFPHYAAARSVTIAAILNDPRASEGAHSRLARLPSGTTVAWCTVHGAGHYSVYAVYPGTAPILVVTPTDSPPPAPTSPSALR